MSISTDKLKKRTYAGIKDFGMIQNGDKVIAAISGGKDSLAMLDFLVSIKKHSDIDFDLVAVYVVPQIPGIKVLSDKLEEIFRGYGVEYIIQSLNIPQGSKLSQGIQDAKTCQWCSYTRRICLLKLAEDIKANKIAYGHHMDDIIDTLFLNISTGSKMDIMPPINHISKGSVCIIRPMVYLREKDIVEYCKNKNISPLSADCIVSAKSNRESIRSVVDSIEDKLPNFVEKMFFSYIEKFEIGTRQK